MELELDCWCAERTRIYLNMEASLAGVIRFYGNEKCRAWFPYPFGKDNFGVMGTNLPGFGVSLAFSR